MSRLSSRIAIPETVLLRRLGGEALILDLETGHYFGLDGVGLRMFSLLEEHGTVLPAFETLCQEYDVARDELRRDLLEFVDLLAARNLLVLAEEPE